LNRIAPGLIATFTMIFTFMLTGVSFLRERTQGTLERLLITPVGRADILMGYLLGFTPFALIQALAILIFTTLGLRVQYQGEFWQIAVLLITLVIVAVNLGILISTFAKNEFQVIQFIPLILAPQIFLSGIIVPTDQMPGIFQMVARVLPLRYAVDGLRSIMIAGEPITSITKELGVLWLVALTLLILAAWTLRRS
jgi:ABC-2 type transport system permease protein